MQEMKHRLIMIFQSTLPVKGATKMHEIGKTTLDVFQSTLPVKGATRMPFNAYALI